jgi:uncharacterized protein (UPF0212 family)
MRAPPPAEMLDAWERGEAEPMSARALRLLALAGTGIDRERLALLPIGRRDALLLEFRALLFGPTLVGVSACPDCGLHVEAVFDAGAIAAHDRADASGISSEHEIAIGGTTIRFRVPDSRDLIALAGCREGDARKHLLDRCVLAVEEDGATDATTRDLSAALADAVERAMAIADPQADVQLDFTCPACAHRWDAAFDIARYLWREIRNWAHRTLRDVHALASAYHWREADILALGERRRQAYLELCRA